MVGLDEARDGHLDEVLDQENRLSDILYLLDHHAAPACFNSK
jgi:hypothetical protein